jgi:asparagine synthetase B (glutamine-hydrolysing)
LGSQPRGYAVEMSGIAGILLLEGSNAKALHDRMLSRIRHRGKATTHTHAASGGVAIISELGRRRKKRQTKQQMIALDSSEFPVSAMDRDLLHLAVTEKRSPRMQAVTAAALVSDGLSIYRSKDGTRPLYYAPLENGFAFASERKSLWALETGFVRPLDPGELVTFLWNGSSQSAQLDPRERPPLDETSTQEMLVAELSGHIRTAFERLRRVRRCGVLFSGGVDSTLAALMASRVCENTTLITVSSETAKDVKASELAAKELNLQHRVIILTEENVWRALPEVIYAIETTNRMDVEIALPFFMAAADAHRQKCSIIVSGQGPDELFAGYSKHEEIMRGKGPEALKDELWAAVCATHEANIARDERAIAYHGVGAFFPYLYSDFVEAALKIPSGMLVRLDRAQRRKLIFRELGRSLSLPAKLANTRKQATQYSSGSSKMLLQAIRANVKEAEKLSKKAAEKIVQDVLDFIGNELGVPPQYGFVREFDINLGPIGQGGARKK